MSTYLAAEPDAVPLVATTLARSLEAVFGQRFQVEACDPASLERAKSSSYSLIPGDEGTWTLTLPIREKGPLRWVARGALPRIDKSTVDRLVNAATRWTREQVELSEAKALLEDCFEQITLDFEHLNWLNDLARHIDLCDASNSTESIAATILPSLRELLAAESVILYRATSSSGQIACRDGESSADDAVCRGLIARLDEAAGDRPVVRNGSFAGSADLADSPEIRNVVLTRVGRGDDSYGWLLALNRLRRSSEAPEPRVDAKCADPREFGTFEAAMAQAAAALLATHHRNRSHLQQREEMFLGVVRALTSAIDSKDPYTHGHSERVGRMAARIAGEMGMSPTEVQQVYVSGLLHDVGKIGVPDEVLKKPGRLTSAEFAEIRKHPEIGYTIIQHVSQLAYAFDGVLHHHESFDGRGYPGGLIGEAIPLFGRILAVADAYDAMTSNRPYRAGMPTEQAETILRDGAGKQWDARVVDAFVSALDDVRAIADSAKCVGRPGADTVVLT